MEQRVIEYGDGGGKAVALRGLSIQSGIPLQRCIELAQQGRLIEAVRAIPSRQRRTTTTSTPRTALEARRALLARMEAAIRAERSLR